MMELNYTSGQQLNTPWASSFLLHTVALQTEPWRLVGWRHHLEVSQSYACEHVRALDVGGGGMSACRMSDLRNANAPCHLNGHVSCLL